MSLPASTTAKSQLNAALGVNAPHYWQTIQQFLAGQISRAEFDESVRESLDTPHLVQLHNALIISLFDTSRKAIASSAPLEAPKVPPRKRRRLLPYQGDDGDALTLTSDRIKRWTVGMGNSERARIRSLETQSAKVDRKRKLPPDEIADGRGVVLLQERGEPPGSRLPLHLTAVTRGQSLQHISDRINLVSAQHNLSAPPRIVASLLMLAVEAKLKQLISRAISLTSVSHAITSIHPALPYKHNPVLSLSSFETLFALSPAVLPYQSAAAMRLALGDPESTDEELVLKDREVKDQRWQLFAILGQRSTVKEALRTMR